MRPFFSIRTLIFVTVLLSSVSAVHAACSGWRGKVFLNEYYAAVGGGNTQFLEIFSSDKTFATSTWQGWSIDVWKKTGGSTTKTTYRFASSATNYECRIGGKTWVTRELTGAEDLEKNIAMVILRDAAGKAVDVLVFDNTIPPAPWPVTGGTGGYYPNFDQPADCPQLGSSLDTQRNAAVASGIKPYNGFNMVLYQANANKNYMRSPDGSGNWYSSDDTGAGSTKTTCSSNNTTIIKTTTTPIVSPGGTAVWKVSLTNPDAAVSGIIVNDTITRFTGDILGTQTTPNGITAVTTSISPAVTACGSVSSAYNATTGSLTWSGITLATGATCTLTVTATVPSSIPENEIFVNTAMTSITGNSLSDTAQVLVKRLVAVDLHVDDPTASSGTQTLQDSSGAGRHGQLVGAAAMTSSGKVCRGVTVPSNSSTTVDAIDTKYNVASGLGGYGGVAFWYKSNQAWSGSTDKMLFDAGNSVANAKFHMMKDSNGALRFHVSDNTPNTYTVQTGNNSYAAGTWVHIAAVWQLMDGTRPYLAIYLNGTLAASYTATSPGADINAGLQNLFIGDAHNPKAEGTDTSADGTYDVIRLYSGNVTTTEITAAMNLLTPCLTKVAGASTFAQGSNGSWSVSIANANQNGGLDIAVTDTITRSSESGAQDLASATATPAANCGSVSSFGTTGGSWNTGTSPAINCTLTISSAIPSNAVVGQTYTNTVTALISNAIQTASASFTVTAGATASGFNAVECATALDGTNCSVASTRTPKSGGVAVPGYDALYTKLAGIPFKLDVVALDNAQSNGVGNFAGTLDVSIVTGSGSGANNCYASETLVQTVATALAFTAGRATTPAITIPGAYPAVRLKFSNCSGTGCPTGSPSYWCSTDGFTIRPQIFNVSISGGPGTSTVADTMFATVHTAGNPFTGVVIASAANYSGTGAALDGSKVLDHNGATQTNNLKDGAGGVIAGGDIVWASNGTGVLTARYDEVGFFTLGVDWIKDTTYTAASSDQANGDCVLNSQANTKTSGKYGCDIGSAATGYFGRFIPSRFSLSAAVTTNVCSMGLTPFTYFGEDGFTTVFTLSALNAVGGVTSNYSGDGSTSSWAKLPLTTWGAAPASAANPGFGFAVATWSPSQPSGASLAASTTAPTASNTNTWVSGSTTVTAKHRIVRPGTVAEPTTVSLTALPVDRDGVTLAAADPLGSVLQRYGRLRIVSAYGSETYALMMPALLEYYSGGRWVTNTDDSCTRLSALSGPTTPVAIGVATTTPRCGVSGSTCTASSGQLCNAAVASVSNGSAGLCLTAPGTTGSADIIFSPQSHLQVNGVTNPRGRAGFGLYNQTGSRIIHRQEVR